MAALALQDWSALPKRLGPLYARYGRWLPALVDLLLVLIIARLLAELVWALVPRPAAAAWQPAPAAVQAAEPGAQVDLASISAAQLFGQYQAPANPNLSALSGAPDSQNVNLALLGIFDYGRTNAHSRALIDNGSQERPYAIGDVVADGVLLKAIFSDRVVIARGGTLETLRLDKNRPNAATDESPPQPTGADNPSSLNQIRAALLANPTKTSDYIRVMPAPASDGSGQIGYHVYPGRNRSVFTQSGLRPGDLVTAINGQDLSDASKSLQLLSQLTSASQVSVTVQRGSQTETLNVNLSE